MISTERIKRRYDEGVSIAQISRETGIPYYALYQTLSSHSRINPETGEQFQSKKEFLEYRKQKRIRKRKEVISSFVSRLEYHKMTQSDLAKRLNVTRQTVSFWFNGITSPSENNFAKLSELLRENKDLNWL